MNIFRRGWQENLVLTGDVIIIAFSYIGSYFIRFDGIPDAQYIDMMVRTIPLVLVIRMAALFYFKLNTSMWQYASLKDLTQIIKMVTVSSVFIVAITMVTTTGHPRSIFIIDWLFLVIGLGGERFIIRLTRPLRWSMKSSSPKRRINVLIVGAGDAGETLLREMVYHHSDNYEVVGLIDDDPNKFDRRIHGIKVLGTRKDISDIVNRLAVEEVIIAIPSASGEVIRNILSHCQIKDLKVRIVPGLQKIINGEIEMKPRTIRPEDLLGRETVRINERDVSAYIKGKKVMVTGAGGSIGSELCRQIARFNPKMLILFDHNENNVYFLSVELQVKYPAAKFKAIIGDIRDVGKLKYTFTRFHPEVIFHAAAHKHVPLMEDNPVAAAENNVLGSRNLIYASCHYRVERFVLISTDKAVNPVSVMGMSKCIAEMILQSKAYQNKNKFMAVRFGNVIGSDGSVVPLFKRQIEDGGPVTVTHPDVKRYFMSIREAASLVLQAGALGKKGEIFTLDMGEQIKVLDIAKNMITLSGFKPDKDIKIKFIGLRQGEKLSEDLLLDKEKDTITPHNKIYISRSLVLDPAVLRRHLKSLERLTVVMNEAGVVAKMKEIIAAGK